MTTRTTSGTSADLACTPIIRQAMKGWFADLRDRVADGAPFVLAPARAPHEILESFDIPYVSNEWWSGIVASRRRSADYFDLLEQQGYHAGLPRYSALSLADALQPPDAERPWGGLPKPSFVLYPGGYTDVARVEALAEAFDCPALSAGVRPEPDRIHHHWWDVSKWMWEDLYDTARIDCMVESYRDIITMCERVSGRKFDIDRLREIVDRVAAQEALFGEAREAMRTAAKSPLSLTEELGDVMTVQWRRGTPWALEMAQAYRDEVVARAAAGIAICPEERVRLGWNGVGLWQATGFYRQFEQSHGAVFVRSLYMSVAVDSYPRYGTGDPVRALASRYAGMVTEIASPPATTEYEKHEVAAYRINGVVMLPNRDRLRFPARALEESGTPVLELPADAVDARGWDEAAMIDRVARFIEDRIHVA